MNEPETEQFEPGSVPVAQAYRIAVEQGMRAAALHASGDTLTQAADQLEAALAQWRSQSEGRAGSVTNRAVRALFRSTLAEIMATLGQVPAAFRSEGERRMAEAEQVQRRAEVLFQAADHQASGLNREAAEAREGLGGAVRRALGSKRGGSDCAECRQRRERNARKRGRK